MESPSLQTDLVCYCCRVRPADIRQAGRDGCQNMEQVRNRTGAGMKCGGCADAVLSLMRGFKRELSAEKSQEAAGQPGLPF